MSVILVLSPFFSSSSNIVKSSASSRAASNLVLIPALRCDGACWPDFCNIDLEREAPTALSYIDFGQFNDDDLDFDFLAFCNLTLSDYVSKFSGCALGLSEVDFHGVNFNSSSMGYLRLVDINFRNANLKNAELTEAFLYRVDLAEAILSGANLDKSVIYETSLIESIINKASNYSGQLETCQTVQRFVK